MSDDEGSLKDFIVDDSVPVPKKLKLDESVEIEILKEEAQKFASNVNSTIIAGRVLRSRDPKEMEKTTRKREKRILPSQAQRTPLTALCSLHGCGSVDKSKTDTKSRGGSHQSPTKRQPIRKPEMGKR